MSDESNAPPPEACPDLAPGTIVHVSYYWQFGRIAAAIPGPRATDRPVYVVDLLGESTVCQVQAFGEALWPCPQALGRPLCLLSPLAGRA